MHVLQIYTAKPSSGAERFDRLRIPKRLNAAVLAFGGGVLMDGVPESIMVGVSWPSSGKVSSEAVIAVFLSNVPESLSDSAGMKQAGRSARYTFGYGAASG
jgi:hypothetical protein